MIWRMDILAQRDIGDWVAIVMFLVFVLLGILGKLGEKWLRGYAERQAEQQRRQREAKGQQRGPAGGQAPSRRRVPPVPQRRQPSVEPAGSRPQPARRPRPYPPMPYQRAPVPVEAPPRLEPAPEPRGEPPVAATVEQEIARLESRLSRLSRLRDLRLAASKPEEADTAAIEARLLRIRPGEAPTGLAQKVHLDLSDPALARQEIMFHEIFSPPKALRPEAEIWDI